MKTTLSLFGLLLAALPAGAQQMNALPGVVYPMSWCLYYSSGPNAGTRAYVSGVGIVYSMTGWYLQSGGHTHDTSLGSGRPPIKIAAGSGVSPTQTWAESYTASNGCADFSMGTPELAGYFYTDATIDQTTCNNPYLACINTHNYWYIQVVNNPASGGPWIQQSSQNPGYRTIQSTVDSGHGYPGTNFLGTSFPLGYIGNWYAGMGSPAFSVIRGSLPTGGLVDGYLVGPLWSPANPDPHKWGYSIDVYSPSTSAAKANFVHAVNTYCPVTWQGGVAIYDFYAQHSPTYTQFTNTTTYIWHVYCPNWAASVYPN